MSRRIALVCLVWTMMMAPSTKGGEPTSGSAELPKQIRGVYGSPTPFWQTGARLTDYGINAVFMHHGGSDEQYRRALDEGVLVFAEFGVFRDRRAAEEHPDELWPVGIDAKRIEPTERFLGLCPTCQWYNRQKLDELRELIRQRPKLSGVWLDYLHFHCDFELPDPPLAQSCFNDSCLASFQQFTRIEPQGATRAEKALWILEHHAAAWTNWKCSVITDFARRARKVLDEQRPGMLLGIYSCPWTDEEYDGGLRRIVGEDIEQLAQVIDVWSPMVYHGNCERGADWSRRYTEWLSQRLSKAELRGQIWPIVQGGGTPNSRPGVSPEDFATALSGAIRGGGQGVMFYHFPAVVSEPQKLEVLKRLYTGGLQALD